MLLRIFRVRVPVEHNDEMAAIEDEVSRLYTPENGCLWSRFIVDYETGEWGNVGLFESREAIVRLGRLPDMQALKTRLAPLLREPPREEIYQVYEPRGDRGGGRRSP